MIFSRLSVSENGILHKDFKSQESSGALYPVLGQVPQRQGPMRGFLCRCLCGGVWESPERGGRECGIGGEGAMQESGFRSNAASPSSFPELWSVNGTAAFILH